MKKTKSKNSNLKLSFAAVPNVVLVGVVCPVVVTDKGKPPG